MKELFIDDIQYNNIEVTCKNYLSDTCKYILLLTNDGEYRISQNQSHVNKFEKIERDFISNYVTTIYDKQVYINNYKNKFIHTHCIPTIQKELLPLQAGDVPATYADVADLVEDLGYQPATPVQQGIDNFVEWYREFFKV